MAESPEVAEMIRGPVADLTSPANASTCASAIRPYVEWSHTLGSLPCQSVQGRRSRSGSRRKPAKAQRTA